MRIDFERSGGFAGMHLRATLDTDELTAEEAQELRRLVEEAGFFGLPARTPPAEGADRFAYTITVSEAGRTHTVETSDGSVPDQLQPLLVRLNRAVRRGKRS